MSELGDTIGNLVRDSNDMKQSLVVQGDSPAWFQRFPNTVKVYGTTRINVNNVASSSTLIWNHPTQGTWNSFNWGDSSAKFIFGHSTYGVFGTSKFGGVFGEELYKVLNVDNTFLEVFKHTEFVDTSLTTATITTSTGTITFADGEVYQSEIIALNDEAYTQCKVTPTGVYDELDLSISFDGGSTFTSATFGSPLLVSNTSKDGIVVKITENPITGLSMPVTMPVTFAGGSVSDYLTKIKIEYS